ncbi:MAG: SDR family NAD(P)-dependent oxidoreductase, partial [Pseudomonadota bacterium]|nr:SDR family NAD(P)-dependent oxidoreductase [Pseudomonadota bacterium]
MGHLDGKIALVTGASAGIGKQTSRILVDAGARVICAARRLSHLESLASELGDAAIALELDVTDVDSVAKLLGRLPADWRDIEILV